eukprot:11970241-Alexandrium_andersonii.AAC.1
MVGGHNVSAIYQTARRPSSMLDCMIRRCGLDYVIECVEQLPCWQRVCANAWGPIAAWLFVMRQLGLRRVEGGGA